LSQQHIFKGIICKDKSNSTTQDTGKKIKNQFHSKNLKFQQPPLPTCTTGYKCIYFYFKTNFNLEKLNFLKFYNFTIISNNKIKVPT